MSAARGPTEAGATHDFPAALHRPAALDGETLPPLMLFPLKRPGQPGSPAVEERRWAPATTTAQPLAATPRSPHGCTRSNAGTGRRTMEQLSATLDVLTFALLVGAASFVVSMCL